MWFQDINRGCECNALGCLCSQWALLAAPFLHYPQASCLPLFDLVIINYHAVATQMLPYLISLTAL